MTGLFPALSYAPTFATRIGLLFARPIRKA